MHAGLKFKKSFPKYEFNFKEVNEMKNCQKTQY